MQKPGFSLHAMPSAGFAYALFKDRKSDRFFAKNFLSTKYPKLDYHQILRSLVNPKTNLV